MARKFIPFDLGPMAKAGDTPFLPKDVSQQILNVSHRPGPRIEKRRAWKVDFPGTGGVGGGGGSNANGYMQWRDKTNNADRLMLAATSLYAKDLAPAETWSAGIVGLVGGMRDFTNFLGAVYWMANFGGGVPQRYSYDGTTLDIDPLRERLSSESMTSWKNRVWLANVYQFVQNRLSAANAYGNGPGWAFTNVAVQTIVSGGVILTTWSPNVLAGVAQGEIAAAYGVAAGSEDTSLALSSSMLGLNVTNRMPMTIEIFAATIVLRSTAYSTGDIRRPDVPNGHRYTAVQAGLGVTAPGAPVWPVAGGTVNDGSVIWRDDGTDAFVSQEFEVDNATENRGRPQTEWAVARIPPVPSTLYVGVRIKYGTTARTNWPPGGVVFGKQDGKVDGDPRKANFGSQLTVGKFFYDFFNKDFADTAAINYPNRMICCEAGFPREWPNTLYWDMVDGSGGIVVARALRDAMCVYKRDAISVYDIVEGADAVNLPMRYRATFKGVGAVGTRAIAEFEGRQYFVGTQEVYAFDVENPPVPLCGDRMREAVFDPAGFLDSASVLRVDEKNREVLVYTQPGTIWKYNIDMQSWSSENITKDANGGASNLVDMAYYRSTVYAIANTNGLVRKDATGVQDEVDGAAPVDVIAEFYLHPLEALPREDQLIEEIELHHNITGDQTGSKLEVAVSFDRGKTFPKYLQKTVPLTNENKPIVVPLWQSGPNLTVRLRHIGHTGPAVFNLFWAGAWVQDLGMPANDSIPTTVAASL